MNDGGNYETDHGIEGEMDVFSQEVQELVAENLFNTIADLNLLQEQWTLYKNPKDMGIKDICDGEYTWNSKTVIMDLFSA